MQTVDEVPAVIVDVIANLQAERHTNPSQAEFARRYYQDLGAFEAMMR